MKILFGSGKIPREGDFDGSLWCKVKIPKYGNFHFGQKKIPAEHFDG